VLRPLERSAYCSSRTALLNKERTMKTLFRLATMLVLLAMSGSWAPGQTVATGRVMREKLTDAQKILEAIMTSDYALLERHSTDLARLTQTQAWSVLKSPEYARQSAAFVQATEDLADAAKRRDLDAAAMHYLTVTQACFECHRYVKNSRIATR
jgi:hypothetical protein